MVEQSLQRPCLAALHLKWPKHPKIEEGVRSHTHRPTKLSVCTLYQATCSLMHAQALQAVHACGVVHGDISPRNILIDPPKVNR